MSENPITVTYSLEEILKQISQKLDRQSEEFNQKLDRLEQKLDRQSEEFNQKLDRQSEEFNQKLDRLEQKLDRQLEEFNQKLDRQSEEFNQKLDRLEQKLDKLDENVDNLTVEMATVKTKLEGLDKRLENQEFISRGVLIGLLLAILGGLAKLFGVIGNP